MTTRERRVAEQNSIVRELDRTNEHIIIYGASKSGKTELLMKLLKEKAHQGISSFVTDTKGECISYMMDVEDECRYILELWDCCGKHGLPFRTSVSDLGPTLLSRMLELNAVQEGLLRLCFRLEDENGYLLLDLEDLLAVLSYLHRFSDSVPREYGHVSIPSLSAITRRILKLQDDGLAGFFAEPALDLRDLIRWGGQQGQVNVLDCERIIRHKSFYQSAILWMLSALVETLPDGVDGQINYVVCIEMGDQFFIDEYLMDYLLRKGIQLVLVCRSAPAQSFDNTRVVEAVGHSQAIVKRQFRMNEESNLYRKYMTTIDRYSAREMLTERIQAMEHAVLVAERSAAEEAQRAQAAKVAREADQAKRNRFPIVQKVVNSAASTVGREFGRELSRGFMDILKRK